MPDLQLEAGMSSFVGKLIGLELYEQAVKELRILKGRLDGSAGADTKKKLNAANTDNKYPSQALAEILDFRAVKPCDPAFSLVVATQIHALRILSAMKKPTHIDAALPILREGHRSSPVSHLLALAGGSGTDTGKVARQLETLSHILLSLTPGVSSKDDGIATDSRLSVSPATALELQVLGLESRLHWWKLAGHRGDVDRDVSSPLSKCLIAYSRRLGNSRSTYALCVSSFSRIFERLQAQGLRPSTSSKSPLAAMYQLLTSMARESGMVEDALQWATRLRSLIDPSVESGVKCCSVAALLLALQLKHNPAVYLQTNDLITQVLSGVQGPLRGDVSELDELLTNVASVRRATMAVVLSNAKDDRTATPQLPKGTTESLETFVLQCPRFCLRWLGKPPDPKSSTKDYLRYEQRRQLLTQSVHHTLDSAFLLAKTQLDGQRLEWDVFEPILKDCLSILENMVNIKTN
jgi:separase